MKKILSRFRILDIIYILLFTFLLIGDFFPHNPVSKAIPQVAIIICIIVLIVFSTFLKKYRIQNTKEDFELKTFMTIYILVLLIILMTIGGKSTVGITFKSITLWIVLLYVFYDIYSSWKKLKQENA